MKITLRQKSRQDKKGRQKRPSQLTEYLLVNEVKKDNTGFWIETFEKLIDL